MRKKVKPIPKYKREAIEREFWQTHDTTDYFDFSKGNRVEIEFDQGWLPSGPSHSGSHVRCLAWLSMTHSTLRRAQGRPEDDRGATKLRVMVREIEP